MSQQNSTVAQNIAKLESLGTGALVGKITVDQKWTTDTSALLPGLKPSE
jgi:hypothetical protein